MEAMLRVQRLPDEQDEIVDLSRASAAQVVMEDEETLATVQHPIPRGSQKSQPKGEAESRESQQGKRKSKETHQDWMQISSTMCLMQRCTRLQKISQIPSATSWKRLVDQASCNRLKKDYSDTICRDNGWTTWLTRETISRKLVETFTSAVCDIQGWLPWSDRRRSSSGSLPRFGDWLKLQIADF